jgi:hypothetical protein
MLVFSKTDKNIVISGKTFYAKEAIKAVGGKWDTVTNSWTISSDVTPEVLKGIEDAAKSAKKKEKDEKVAERAFAVSPEGRAMAKEEERKKILACLEEKKKTGAYNWICCENCVVINWERQHTSCMACAQWSGQSWNSFRVRGSIFTGD